MGRALNNLRLTIGGPESPAGEAAARTHVIPISGLSRLMEAPEKAVDPAIEGANMVSGEYLMARNINGTLPLAPRACGGFGKLINSMMGQELAPVQVGACIRMRFVGEEASCKIVADTTGDTLSSAIGALGSEAGDAAFGTAGSIDLTATGTDTVGELITEIDGYADYECEKLFGLDSVDAGDVVNLTYGQGKNKWVYLWFSSVDSGVYLHRFPVILPNEPERPTYSIQQDGLHSNYLDLGCVVDTLTLSGALKGMITGEVGILGFTRADDQAASGLTPADVQPFIYQSGGFSLGSLDFDYIRSISWNFANNHNAEGYGQGTLSRRYHEKGQFDLAGTMQARFHADVFANRARAFDDSRVALSAYYKGGYFDVNKTIPELMLIETPYCQFNQYEETENSGQIDASIEFRAVAPKGIVYDAPVTVSLLTTDSGAY